MSYITKTNLALNCLLGSQITQFGGLYAVSKKLDLEIKIFREHINTYLGGESHGIQLSEAFDLDHYLHSIVDVQPIDKIHNLQNTIIDDDVFKLDPNFNFNIFSTLFENFKILVFSNDISWCKDNIFGDKIYYSENNSNHVDMCMMTMCDHNIIANSGFSFWGAYLNKNENKIVICPTRYVDDRAPSYYQFINYNWYPKEWISLDII